MAAALQQGLPTGDARAGLLTGPIGFIGPGRVGTALASLLNARGVEIAGVSGRDAAAAKKMAGAAGLGAGKARSRAATVRASAVVFLTVPDDAIGPLCREIAEAEGWREGQGVVHCSGALPSDVLQPAREQAALAASFHPLQAFATASAAIANMPGSTFAIEGDRLLAAYLDSLALLLGGTPVHLGAAGKPLYHAAAVIASNYSVTLAALASELLVKTGIAPDEATALGYLLPLLRGTLDNLHALGLPAALTGPLARGDAGTVARHLEELDACDPALAHLYRHLAQMSLPLAQRKGNLSAEEMRVLEGLVKRET